MIRFKNKAIWNAASLAAVSATLSDPAFLHRERKDALSSLDTLNPADTKAAMTTLKDSLALFIKDSLDVAKEHKSALDKQTAELKSAQTVSAETKGKLEETTAKLTANAEEIQKLQTIVKALEAHMARPEISGTAKDKEDKSTEDAINVLKQMHHYKKIETPFDVKNYNLDDAKVALDTVDKIWRLKAGERHEVHLEGMELKSLNTISIEGHFFVKPAMSSRIITCQTEYSEILDLFTQENISNASIEYMIDTDDDDDGGWACENKCGVTPSELSKPAVIEIVANEIRKRICITHKMLEDSAIDITAYATRKVARKFAKDVTKAVVTGATPGMPQGILTYDQWGLMNSGSVTGTPSGQFSWQDLVLLYYQLDVQWQANATFLMNRKTLGKMLTMADGEGRPIWQPQVIANGGMPTILGRPVRIVTHMPDIGVGTRPIAVGDWKEAYTVVNRLGMTMIRDPFTKADCGVIWTFRQRIGGGVTCPLAAKFMLIA